MHMIPAKFIEESIAKKLQDITANFFNIFNHPFMKMIFSIRPMAR